MCGVGCYANEAAMLLKMSYICSAAGSFVKARPVDVDKGV